MPNKLQQYYKNVNLCPVQHTVNVKYALVIVHLQNTLAIVNIKYALVIVHLQNTL